MQGYEAEKNGAARSWRARPPGVRRSAPLLDIGLPLARTPRDHRLGLHEGRRAALQALLGSLLPLLTACAAAEPLPSAPAISAAATDLSVAQASTEAAKSGWVRDGDWYQWVEPASTEAAKSGWVRDGNWYRCISSASQSAAFELKEQRSIDDLDHPLLNGTLAWATPDGSHLARFDFDVSETSITYYGPDCKPLFTRIVADEIHVAHILLGGRRLLVSMASPYTLKWGEDWRQFGRIHLFDEKGNQLLELGPHEVEETPFQLYHDGRFSRTYVSTYRDPITQEWKSFEIFIEIETGKHHIYWINYKEGRPPAAYSLSPDGKLEINDWRDTNPIDPSVGAPVPEEDRKKRNIKIYHEFQF